MVYFLVSLASTTLTSVVTSTKTYTHLSQYERISKPEIQQSLLIVSDMTSHFGREVAFKLAEMGFFVLAGVRTESDRKAYTGYNTVKGRHGNKLIVICSLLPSSMCRMPLGYYLSDGLSSDYSFSNNDSLYQ